MSRSEPNWMKGQIARTNKSKATSEEYTKQRREERQQVKWERARKEREAIDQKLFEEAGLVLEKEIISSDGSSSIEEQALVESNNVSTTITSNGHTWAKSLEYFPSPVGPIELLSLPNSIADLEKWAYDDEPASLASHLPSPVGPMELLSLPNSAADLEKWANGDKLASLAHRKGLGITSGSQSPLELQSNSESITNGFVHVPNGNEQRTARVETKDPSEMYEVTSHAANGETTGTNDDTTNGSVQSDEIMHSSNSTPNGSALTNGSSGSPEAPRLRSQKSVRFSPTVEKNTFIQTEPPSPDQSLAPSTSTSIFIEAKEEQVIQEQEHFQLMMEEAFFLSYSLGALSILDPVRNLPIPNQDLFSLFRKSSHFPPQSNPVLAPDDTFLINYVVYHHYRSLGWCVRGGAKFSCDFMLYNRGPVFSHAEFAILIIPSYVDPYWHSDPFLQNYVKGQEKISWSWMHCINRVISQVKKKLILVYVDVPKPMAADAEELGIDEVLGRYKIREFVMRRWLSNRERG